MSVKRPHEEVTIGHLENKTKFEVSDNTSVTPVYSKKWLATRLRLVKKIEWTPLILEYENTIFIFKSIGLQDFKHKRIILGLRTSF